MPLSRQQRALAELVLHRGHRYGDLAELLGTDEDEARAQAHALVAELAGRPLRARTADLVLGQLDGDERTAEAAALSSDPAERDAAAEVVAKLRLLVPEREVPELPAASRGPAAAPGRAAPASVPHTPPTLDRLESPPFETGPDVPRRRRRRRPWGPALAFAAAAALAAATVALLGGGDEDEPDVAGPAPVPAAAAPAPPILLTPQDAAPIGASGRAALGRSGDQAVLQFRAQGLRPTRGRERYVVWLYATRDAAVALTEGRTVGEDGVLEGAAVIPPPADAVLAQARFVDVSLEPVRQVTGSPRYRGRSVLRGPLRG